MNNEAMHQAARVYVAGHRGLVGSALVRRLEKDGYQNLLLRSHSELDLTDSQAVHGFFSAQRPEYVFLAAARVGGIWANSTYPAEFIRENLCIQTHVLHEAFKAKVKRLLFLGSSCIYPRDCPQPMREEYLLSGPLEASNRAYALAKIAGIEMCWSYNRQYGTRFLAVMPANVYGPGDNYDLQSSHVLPALIRKMHEAQLAAAPSVSVWGSGTPRREFLHSDDLADACMYLMEQPADRLSAIFEDDQTPPLVNIGCGKDSSIRELAQRVRRIVGFAGDTVWDPGKPDGTQRKLLDVSRLAALGWRPSIRLDDGIAGTYQAYQDNFDQVRFVHR